MNNIFKNIVGWILVIAGVVLIGWVLYYTFNIFTGKAQAPEIFAGQSADIPAGNISVAQISDIQAQIEEMMQEQLKGLLFSVDLPKILNLAGWLMLASVFIFGGSQIAGIGIKLLNK